MKNMYNKVIIEPMMLMMMVAPWPINLNTWGMASRIPLVKSSLFTMLVISLAFSLIHCCMVSGMLVMWAVLWI